MTSVAENFSQKFLKTGDAEFFSPGRVNLIGEHIDYCGGLVMPMAINRGTRAVAAKNGDGVVRIYSERFNEGREIPLQAGRSIGHWSDFVVGVVSELLSDSSHDQSITQDALTGVDIYVADDIGAGGLSSSASFSILVSHVLLWAAGVRVVDIPAKLDLARLCQKVEHNFVGVNCGIMDQAAVALGGVIVLNCSDLSFTPVTPDFGDYSLQVMDTQHERTLAGSKYNERVLEISEIVDQLQDAFRLNNLCDIEVPDLTRALLMLDKANLQRRLRHVVTENARVVQASRALESQQFEVFGGLMNASHDSLHADYEVTGDALNCIVNLSREQPGTIGARMTGAGFGGCALALVEKSQVNRHNQVVSRAFFAETGRVPRIFSVNTAPAAGLL
tara:strand:+ start:16725 stop:17891 length:1167 start_codon:yes stop_codon:yes gene_type:complete